ncbi:MAG: LOG family protein [Pseudomonadota bacterium]
MTETRHSILRSVSEDLERVDGVPETPQTLSPAYRLAFEDSGFLRSDEMRPVRLQLELQKFEMILNRMGIETTIVMFGGARILSPGKRHTARTPYLAELTKFYDEARLFARLAGTACMERGGREYVVTTGGGPGVMEAGNRGAQEAGAPSIGLSILLPHEQAPNEYVTPELSFNFHYFAIRKMHFLMRARAIAVFPGGFGTLDELFETLTLIQTDRMKPVPVILFGAEFWQRIVNWRALCEAGTISERDLDLFQMVDSAQEGWEIICDAEGIAH